MIAIVLAAAAVATSPMPTSLHQFDLVCDGVTSRYTNTAAPPAPYHWQGSFDIDKSRYNANGDKATSALQVSDDTLIFLDTVTSSYTINRKTGEFTRSAPSVGLFSSGKCQVAPLTKMPK